MLRELRRALLMVLLMTAVTGVGYPLAVLASAHVLFPHQAGGSLIVRDGHVIGSELLGQRFTQPGYFHPRPSAAGAEGYDATASGGSNLGPTSRQLVERVQSDVQKLRAEQPGQSVPVDLVTTSASGLDPHITPAAAAFQISRVAKARGLTEDQVRGLVEQYTADRTLGLLGEPRVNVLRLNLALDALQRR